MVSLYSFIIRINLSESTNFNFYCCCYDVSIADMLLELLSNRTSFVTFSHKPYDFRCIKMIEFQELKDLCRSSVEKCSPKPLNSCRKS